MRASAEQNPAKRPRREIEDARSGKSAQERHCPKIQGSQEKTFVARGPPHKEGPAGSVQRPTEDWLDWLGLLCPGPKDKGQKRKKTAVSKRDGTDNAAFEIVMYEVSVISFHFGTFLVDGLGKERRRRRASCSL